MAKGPGAWIDPRVFRAEESRRAEINRMVNEDKRIFISHCWRKTKQLGDNDDIQMKKRQMISHLSKPESVRALADHWFVLPSVGVRG